MQVELSPSSTLSNLSHYSSTRPLHLPVGNWPASTHLSRPPPNTSQYQREAGTYAAFLVAIGHEVSLTIRRGLGSERETIHIRISGRPRHAQSTASLKKQPRGVYLSVAPHSIPTRMPLFKKSKKSRKPSLHPMSLGIPTHVAVGALGINADLPSDTGSSEGVLRPVRQADCIDLTLLQD